MSLMFLLLLCACGNTLPRVTVEPPSSDDARLLYLTKLAWNSRNDLPHGEMPDVLVTDSESLATFHDLCRVCAGSNVEPNCSILWGTNQTPLRAGACSATHNRVYGPLGIFTPSNYWRLIVLAPVRPPAQGEDAQTYHRRMDQQREALVVHEAVHWMASSALHTLDPSHSNPKLWCQGTCAPGNVEGDARAAARN